MLTKIIYKNFRSNLKNYILFFLSNIVASMELFVFRGLKEIVLQIVKDTETAFLFRIDFTMALGMISVITIMLMAYAMIYVFANDWSIVVVDKSSVFVVVDTCFKSRSKSSKLLIIKPPLIFTFTIY